MTLQERRDRRSTALRAVPGHNGDAQHPGLTRFVTLGAIGGWPLIVAGALPIHCVSMYRSD